MFRLAHISDIHLPLEPTATLAQLMGKRVTGYLNWKFNRKHELGGLYLQTLINGLKGEQIDYLVVSGDLCNLSLADEFDNARNFLEDLGEPNSTTVQFGNHDAYVPGALASAMDAWQAYARGDDKPLTSHDDFPVVRVRKQVALIACNSAEATAPFFATGYFREAQAKRLAEILDKYRNFCRIVSIHHPPVRNSTPWQKRLIGQRKFAEAISAHGAELVIHGHTHLATVNHLQGPNGPVPVVCVPAAGNGHGKSRPAGRYNIYTVSQSKAGWSISLEAKACTADLKGVETVLNQKL